MANAKSKMKITSEELASYYIPEPHWPEGQPHPSWVDTPLIYTSALIAQAPLDFQKERAARAQVQEEWTAASQRSLYAITQPTLF